jgi:transcriptional regulator with XRE-family HTH domain
MSLSPEHCERIHAGEHPLKVWREIRGLEQTDLRRETKIAVGRIDQIEHHKGPRITRGEAQALARALDIASANLLPMSYASCYALDDLDEDEILTRD